jgi:hypothetical protein
MALIEINPLNPFQRSPLHRRPIHWTGPWRLYHVTGYEELVLQQPLRPGDLLVLTKIAVEHSCSLFKVHQLLLHSATMDYRKFRSHANSVPRLPRQATTSRRC